MRTEDICPCDETERMTGYGYCAEITPAEEWEPTDAEIARLWADVRARITLLIDTGNAGLLEMRAMQRAMQLIRFMGERIDHLDHLLAQAVKDRDSNRLLAARYAKDRMAGHDFVLLAGEMDMLYKGQNPELRRAINELSAKGASMTVRPPEVSDEIHRMLLRHELPEF